MEDVSRLEPNTMLLIRAGDAQAVLDYLSAQPCGAVYALVTALLKLEPVVLPAASPRKSPAD